MHDSPDRPFACVCDPQVRMKLMQPGHTVGAGELENVHEFTSQWINPNRREGGVDDGSSFMNKDSFRDVANRDNLEDECYAELEMSYTSYTPGMYSLHLFQERLPGAPDRVAFPGSPFHINIVANASDNIIANAAIVDSKGAVPGDYKIARAVFEDAQRKWGECTIDAFASAATALLPRFWTPTDFSEAEGASACPGLDLDPISIPTVSPRTHPCVHSVHPRGLGGPCLVLQQATPLRKSGRRGRKCGRTPRASGCRSSSLSSNLHRASPR